MKRVFLFFAVNILVMTTISVILRVLGVQPYLNAYGINYSQLAIFCLVWGMGGSLISLGMSRMMAKWMMGVRLVDPNTMDSELGWLVQTIHNLARAANLPQMPQVGIYDSPELNAFATGPTASRALVAVSTGLLGRMSHDEIEGVLGHEITHISNGDMVTMTLLQGIVNAFAMFAARVIAFFINQALSSRDNEREGGGLGYFGYMITVMLLEWVFMLLGMIVVTAFSRLREYRADAGGARLAGRTNMIAALRKLQQAYEIVDPNGAEQGAFRSMKISNHRGFLALFSTHPPLEERIARLQSAT